LHKEKRFPFIHFFFENIPCLLSHQFNYTKSTVHKNKIFTKSTNSEDIVKRFAYCLLPYFTTDSEKYFTLLFWHFMVTFKIISKNNELMINFKYNDKKNRVRERKNMYGITLHHREYFCMLPFYLILFF
jgi:hypothetical protein